MKSDLLYRAVRFVGTLIFHLASAPRVLHAERARRAGAYLLAANHTCAYDAPLIIAVTPRIIHWLSIVELFQHPLSRWFLGNFGALPLDRGKVDTKTVRQMTRLLRAGNVVGMFPEGGVRRAQDSVVQCGAMDPGICKLAELANVPVLPCVVLGGEKFRCWRSWVPGARTRWAVAFGEPIFSRHASGRGASRLAMAEEITQSLRSLHAEVAAYV